MPKGGWIKKTASVTTKKPIRKRSVAVKKRTSFAAKVMSVVNKTSETMHATHTVDNVAYNSGISGSADITRVIPQITQGDDDNMRKGDAISALRMNVRGHYLLNTNNNATSDARIAVRMMIVQPRQFSNTQDAITSNSWLNHLLKRGATSVAFTGIINDLYSDINTDRIIKYYDRVQYISIPFQVATGAGLAYVDTHQSVKFFNINFNWKNKILKYDTIDGGLTPTNYAPVLLCGYVHLDGSAPDTGSTALSVSFVSNLYYKDL